MTLPFQISLTPPLSSYPMTIEENLVLPLYSTIYITSPIGEGLEVRGPDGHPAASHAVVDAKVHHQRWGPDSEEGVPADVVEDSGVLPAHLCIEEVGGPWGCEESLFDWWRDLSDEGSRDSCWAYRSRLEDGERSTMMVLRLLWELLRVALLLMLRVPGNRSYLVFDCQCYAPQVCLTSHSIFIFNNWGQFHTILLRWGKWKVSVRVKSE